jgi:hypothetical protein
VSVGRTFLTGIVKGSAATSHAPCLLVFLRWWIDDGVGKQHAGGGQMIVSMSIMPIKVEHHLNDDSFEIVHAI